MNLEEFEKTKGVLRCKYCDSLELHFVKKPDGFAHYGAVACANCGRHHDWVKRPEQAIEEPARPANHVWGDPPGKEKAPRYTPNQIAHPQTLEERVASLEHDLSILTQIFVGKRQ